MALPAPNALLALPTPNALPAPNALLALPASNALVALPAPNALFALPAPNDLRNTLPTMRMNTNFFIKGGSLMSVSHGFNLSSNSLSMTLLIAIKESFYLFEHYAKIYNIQAKMHKRYPDSMHLFTTGFGTSSFTVFILELNRVGNSVFLDLQWTINGILQNPLRFSPFIPLYVLFT